MTGLFKLSRKFHETIGDELAEEIEAGFERLDALNSTAFRELFEVRLQQRFAEFRSEVHRDMGELRQDMSAMKIELKQEISEVRVSLASMESRLMRWMFLFWVGTIGIAVLQRL